ncbi:MAG: hypothetical protein KH009_07845 [Clostridiales bacterium]|nr:hypothetical protein [Clostridiales bacterium]
MQFLYAVSIGGKMIFFSSLIPENKFETIEYIANKIGLSVSEDDFCAQFEAAVRAELGIELKRQPIKYVFRVRRK